MDTIYDFYEASLLSLQRQVEDLKTEREQLEKDNAHLQMLLDRAIHLAELIEHKLTYLMQPPETGGLGGSAPQY